MNQFKFYTQLFTTELWNKKWLFLVLFWAFSILGIVVVFLIPDQYKTRAGIYIDTDQLLAQVLKDTTFVIDKSAESQAQKVKQMIYSTTSLRKVLRSVSSDNYDLSPTQEAVKLEEMRKSLSFGSLNPDTAVKDYYEISYVHKDPVIAYNTLKQILDLFIETNIRQMSSKNDRALAVSEDSLKIRQRELAEAQAMMAKFKQKNIELTEGSTILISEMQRMQDVIRSYPSQKSLLQSKLSSVTSLLSQTPRKTGATAAIDPACDFSDIEKELASAKARGLTDLHPDVVYYTDLYNRKKQNCIKSGGAGSVDGTVNPAYLQLSEQSSIIKSDLEALDVEYANAKKRITEIEDLLNRRPLAMEKLRILQSKLKKASDALKDATSSNDILQGTIDLSRKSGLISYEVIEEVQMPVLPEKPNRLLLFIGSFLGSLIGAVSYILMKLKLDKRMLTINYLRESFDLPVLGSITMIDKPNYKPDSFNTMIWVSGIILLTLVYALMIRFVVFSSVKFDFSIFTNLFKKLFQLFV